MARTKRPRTSRAGKTTRRAGTARTAKKTSRRAAGAKAGAARRSAKTRRQKAKTVARKRPARKTARGRSVAAAKPKKAAPRSAAKAKKAAPARRAAAAKPIRRVPGASGGRTTSAPARRAARQARPPALDRARRTLAEAAPPEGPPSSLDLDRSASAVRTGRAEVAQRLHEHTSTSPAMTAGDVDADWASADSVGDEAPGGDNPTPDQDVVDEIGKALGVEYNDDAELQGGDEIRERDRHRWELDPASAEDFEEH